LIVDSVAALTPRAEIEGEMGDSQVGLQARLMSKALRKLTGAISKTGCCCIFINQLREKIGVMFGNPETTTGGNALKFYSSIRIDIRRSTQIKDGDAVSGNRTRVKIVKNKVAPPFAKAEFDIMYGKGISKSGEILDLAVELGMVKKSGSWFSYGETKLGQGRDAVKSLIEDNPELMDELEEKIKAEIAEKYVRNLGYEPYLCQSEDEAREKVKDLPKKNQWPCYFSESNTTGEKDFEEFFTEKELLDMDRFKSVGIIKNGFSFDNLKLEHFTHTIRNMKDAGKWEKAELVSLFKEMIPDFLHKEIGKYLDEKM